MKKYLAVFLVVNSIYSFPVHAKTVDDSPFGPNVLVFDPTMSSAQINDRINQLYNGQRFNEFGTNRYALLFKPGHYGDNGDVDVRVGYYTHVMGLGNSPDDVVIKGAVRTQDAPPNGPVDGGPGALTNFWRATENLAVIPTLGSINYPNAVPKNQNVWAVSQAAPLRRVHIMGTLRLFELGWSSGGFLGNSKVDNQIVSGSQQQWFTRNSAFGNWVDGNWNMVFIGSTGALPGGQWPAAPFTFVDKTPVVREKPFLTYNAATNLYSVMVPNLRRDSVGVDWAPGTSLPLTNFYIARSDTDSAATINAALQQGKHLILTPGVYHLNDTIKVNNPNTIILGIGLPTLTNDNALPAMTIADVDGVQLAGVLFDAGANSVNTILQVGENGSQKSHSANPTFLFDVFCRIGGAHAGVAKSCVTINSNDVVGDYFWLWRADHGNNVGWNVNVADTGLIVNGNNVTLYGLMVEHFEKYQTMWNGENGKVYFYQSEIPYDPPSQAAWMNGAKRGYASYKIADTVNTHTAYGLGIYNFFRDADVFLDSAIEAPLNCGMNFNHMVTFWLDGHPNSGITHIINNEGGANSPGNKKMTFNTWPWNTPFC